MAELIGGTLDDSWRWSCWVLADAARSGRHAGPADVVAWRAAARREQAELF